MDLIKLSTEGSRLDDEKHAHGGDEEIKGFRSTILFIRKRGFLSRLIALALAPTSAVWSILLCAVLLLNALLLLITLGRIERLKESFLYGRRKTLLVLFLTASSVVGVFTPTWGFAILYGYIRFKAGQYGLTSEGVADLLNGVL